MIDTSITPYVVERVCKRISEEGLTLYESVEGICSLRGLLNARNMNDDYAEALKVALECRNEHLIKKMLDVCIEPERLPADKTVHVKTLQWIVERSAVREPKKIELSAPGGEPLNPFLVQVVAASE